MHTSYSTSSQPRKLILIQNQADNCLYSMEYINNTSLKIELYEKYKPNPYCLLVSVFRAASLAVSKPIKC